MCISFFFCETGDLQCSKAFFQQPVQALFHSFDAYLCDFPRKRNPEAALNVCAARKDPFVAGLHISGTARKITCHTDHTQKLEHIRFAQ